MIRLRTRAKACFTLICTLVYTPAIAQLQSTVIDSGSRGRNTSVGQRDRPEYDSPGIALGGFLLSPEVALDAAYTDNAFLAETDKKSDAVLSLRPVVRINSTWSRHALAAQVQGNFRRYLDNTIRNEDGFGASVRGRYELGTNASISTSVRAQHRYESQYDLTSAEGGSATIPVDDFAGTLIGSTTRGRLRFSLGAIASRLNYHDFRTSTGTTIDQDTRDRASIAGAAQVDYSINFGASTFVRLGYEAIDYDEGLGTGFANRNSKAVQLIAGASFDLTALVRGRIGAGYVERDYDDSRFEDISGLSVEGQIEYFPTPLTTVTLDAHRQIEDSSISAQGGFFVTGGALQVDHELLRNVLLNAAVAYDNANYAGPRDSINLWRVSGGAQYLLNRHVSLNSSVSYGSRSQDANAPGNPFNELRSSLSIRYRF